MYELQIADARFNVTNAKSLLISVSGATNAAETDAVIPLTRVDPYDGVRGGLTALPNAAAGTDGGVPVLATVGNDLIVAGVAGAILATPANKLVTDQDGNVHAVLTGAANAYIVGFYDGTAQWAIPEDKAQRMGAAFQHLLDVDTPAFTAESVNQTADVGTRVPQAVAMAQIGGTGGGANTELWHSVKLWRRFGAEVTLIPTWKADPVWRRRLDALGCRTFESNPDDLQNVPGLAGSIVVSMCNTRFLAVAAQFRELGCKIVWVGCMNWLFADERLHYRRHGPFERHVFQSRYQHETLFPQLAKHGYEERHVRIIRGAFDIDEFPFRPLSHASGEQFVVGRFSRPAPEKFSLRTWAIYARTPPPMAARVMGWDRAVEARVGRPPRWAECLPPGAETAQAFLGRLHCLVQAGGGAVENWPRVGLEAMAAGVPVAVDNQGGWPEMIRHAETGFLCDNEEEMVGCVARLARDAAYRRMIIEQARHAVETELADPEMFWHQWKTLLMELS